MPTKWHRPTCTTCCRRSMLTDGIDLVLDLRASPAAPGPRRRPRADGATWTYSPSSPLTSGDEPSRLADDPDFRRGWPRPRSTSRPTPTSTPSRWRGSSTTFARVLGDPALPHLFFIDGGALAVENALKVAFDWKSRRNAAPGGPAGWHQVLHLTQRSTAAAATRCRSPTPSRRRPRSSRSSTGRASPSALPRRRARRRRGRAARAGAGRAAFERAPDDIACFITEPIQGEGGDNHFRAGVPAGHAGAVPRARRAAHLRRGADRRRSHRYRVGLPATGRRRRTSSPSARRPRCAASWRAAGRRGARQRLHRQLAGINSTWGGNLVDMVRCTPDPRDHRAEETRFNNTAERGAHFSMSSERSQRTSRSRSPRPWPRPHVRLHTAEGVAQREADWTDRLWQRGVVMLACGERGVRVRPPGDGDPRGGDRGVGGSRRARS